MMWLSSGWYDLYKTSALAHSFAWRIFFWCKILRLLTFSVPFGWSTGTATSKLGLIHLCNCRSRRFAALAMFFFPEVVEVWLFLTSEVFWCVCMWNLIGWCMSSCVSPILNSASPELLMPWFSGGLGTLDCNAMKARFRKIQWNVPHGPDRIHSNS